MATVEGKDVIVTIDGVDITDYVNSVTFSRSVNSNESTTFGSAAASGAQRFQPGLVTGTVSLGGLVETYSITGGPGPVFDDLLDTKAVVTFVYKAEGTGSGKPSRTVDVFVTSYDEEATPDGLVEWSAELQMSDGISTTTT